VEIARRFPRAVEAEGNLLLVFLRFHGPAFPPSSSAYALSSLKAREQFLLCRLQPAAAAVSVSRRDSRIQFVNRQVPFRCRARSGSCRRISQGVRIPSVHSLYFPLGADHFLGHAAGPMKVQIRVEGLSVEGFHRRRCGAAIVIVPHVLADHLAVLGFHQSVCSLLAGPRFRRSARSASLVQQLGSPCCS